MEESTPGPAPREETVVKKPSRKISPALFAFALFCFALPFVTVSCPMGEYTFSGLNLVAGGEAMGERFGAEPLAVLALLLVVVGLLVSFVKSPKFVIVNIIAAGMGTWALMGLHLKLVVDAKELDELARVQTEVGFWLVFLSLVGVMAANIAWLLGTESATVDAVRAPAESPPDLAGRPSGAG